MAGAIMSVTGWCTSWAQWSAYDDALARDRHVRGSVFVSNANWGVPEREVDERRGDRAHSAVAAVATSVERHAATVAVLERLGIVKPSAFYTVAGTPIAAALIGGRISMVVEPCAVSLHDSALLIPHQILGGVATTAGGAPLNPLAVYEQTADDLRPDAKPFTDGYIAWGGDVITAGVAVA